MRCLLNVLLTGCLLLTISPVRAQQPVVKPDADDPAQPFPVWQGDAPGSEKWTRTEVTFAGFGNQPMVRNVVRPTLTPYLPKAGTGNGSAVVIAPGGGFRFLSWESEGTKVAQWLSERGVAAFVLKYRLVDTGATDAEFQKRLQEMFQKLSKPGVGEKPGGPLDDLETAAVVAMASEDGRQAIKVLRRRAGEWGVAKDRIGIMGFSAGGMVASAVALQHDAESRPNFVGAIYGAPFDAVTAPQDAPPLFILCADDDPLAASNCARLYLTWKGAGKSSELHIYAKGGHGFGMNKQGLPVDSWIERFGSWLDAQGLLKPPP